MLSLRRRALPFWALFTIAGLGSLVVLWMRFSSLLRCWHWEIAEGREGPGIYAIWRVLHHYPLYEWPNRPPYSLTLYNFGFYHFYAAIMRVIGASDEGLLLGPRLLTLSGSLLGAALFARLAWSLAPVRDLAGKIALGALCVGVWFGTQLLAWWAFSIRPDVWGLLLGFAGVALVLRALESDSPVTSLLASFVFFVAWSLKQSAIMSFFGSLVAVFVLRRRIRHLAALAGPFAILVALCLLFGGERYRISILVAPAISRFRWGLFQEVLSRALPQNVWAFGFAPLAFLIEARKGFVAAWRRRPLAEQALLLIGVSAVALGLTGLGREGANKNYLFDGYAVSALASWVTLVRLLGAEPVPRGTLLFGAILLVPWAAFPVAQLAGGGRLGRVEFCGAPEPVLAELEQTIDHLPKPLFTDNDVFAQPWHSTNDRYPAVVLDGTWADIAVREGFVPHGFLDAWLAERHYASAVVPDGIPLVEAWRARGVSCSEFPEMVHGSKLAICRLPYAASGREPSAVPAH
jgi:hypothetical protein